MEGDKFFVFWISAL